MNCETTLDQLNDYLDGFTSKNVSQAIDLHLESCPTCAERVSQHRLYLEALNEFAVEPLLAGEGARLLRRAKQEVEAERYKQSHRMSFFKGFSAAAIIVLGLFLGADFMKTGKGYGPQTSDQNILAQSGQLHSVHVLIYVPSDMTGVELAIDLPDYMAIDGYEDLQRISWTTDLQEGANQLEIPVYVSPGTILNRNHTIAATLEYKNKSRTFQLDVDLKADRNRGQGADYEPAKSTNAIPLQLGDHHA